MPQSNSLLNDEQREAVLELIDFGIAVLWAWFVAAAL
jgi:hypothetical protein